MKRIVNLAIVGTGGMAQRHVQLFGEIPACRLVACCDIVPGRAQAFARRHGIPAAYESSAELYRHEQLDGVSIVAGDAAHAPLALEAFKAGVAVLCEKPLAPTLAEARRMARAARRSGLVNSVNFSYRDSPATQQAARLVTRGRLGNIRHVEGRYLQSWLAPSPWPDWRKNEALLWRLSTRHGSLGCLGDVGVHLFDFARFIVGDITRIHCRLGTWPKQPRIGDYVYDANDGFVANVSFRNGALGVLHSSRWASGHSNTVAIRVHGDHGALDLDLDRPEGEQLRACLGPRALRRQEWKTIPCPTTPNNCRRFVTALRGGRPTQNDFNDGLRAQACLDASFRSHAEDRSIRIR